MFKRFLAMFQNRSPQNGPITVVSGLPRTGTSMMMQILEAGGLPPLTDNIREANVDNPKGYYEFERVKKLPKGDDAWLIQAQGKVVKIIATLLVYLPNTYTYRVVFMQRAIPEILASQRAMLLRRGEDPNKTSDEELAQLFEKHLAQVNGWINNQPNIKRININYNQVVENPRAPLGQVNRFLDNQLDVEKMVQVVDSSLYRQRNKTRSG